MHAGRELILHMNCIYKLAPVQGIYVDPYLATGMTKASNEKPNMQSS